MTAAFMRQPAAGGASRSMCSLQRVSAVGGDPLGKERQRDRRRGRRSRAPPRCVPRLVSIVGGATACTAVSRRNVDAVRLFQPARERGDRRRGSRPAARAGCAERAAKTSPAEHREALADLGRASAARSLRPSRWPGRPRARRAPPAGARPRRARDARSRMPAAAATSSPDVARAHGALPASCRAAAR